MMYKEVFSDKNIISIEEDESSLLKEYASRIENEIPPGNNDSAKDNNAIGDFIIWKTILKIGKNMKTNVVFVSNDEKNDWMLKGNKKSISTRYELIDEFFRETGGFNFISMPYISFLNRQGLIVEEIENKRNLSTISLEELLEQIHHHLAIFLSDSKENNDEYSCLDSDLLSEYLSNFNSLLRIIKSTDDFSDDVNIFLMKDTLEKISKLNYIIDFESHRMKRSTTDIEEELKAYIKKFINIYENYSAGKYF